MEYEISNVVDPEFTIVAKCANDSSDRRVRQHVAR